MTNRATQAHPFLNVTQVRDRTANYDEATGEVRAVEAHCITPVNIQWIRCFYPRKNGESGTRITFHDGGGFAITESYQDFRAKVFSKARFADLTMKVSENRQELLPAPDSDDFGGGGDDEHADIDASVVEQFGPVCVNAIYVRSFNERRDGKEGTRLTFSNSKGMVVKETVTEAYEKLIGVPITALPAPAE